jgi:hypothetical protein
MTMRKYLRAIGHDADPVGLNIRLYHLSQVFAGRFDDQGLFRPLTGDPGRINIEVYC